MWENQISSDPCSEKIDQYPLLHSLTWNALNSVDSGLRLNR